MRQFICSEKQRKDGSVWITGKDYLYLSRSLRLKTGDIIDVSFLDGRLLPMQATRITKKEVILSPVSDPADMQNTRAKVQGVVAEKVQASLKGTPEYWLFQFLPKIQKMDQIVRQATECGVAVIVPVIGEFTVRGNEPPRIERWERIIKEARQQSGSPVQTRVIEPAGIADSLNIWNLHCRENSLAQNGFVLHEDPATGLDSLVLAAAGQNDMNSVALAVGCEGGISPAELQQLHESGFENIHFATNVLRAETAAIYGLAVIQQIFAYGLPVNDKTVTEN